MTADEAIKLAKSIEGIVWVSEIIQPQESSLEKAIKKNKEIKERLKKERENNNERTIRNWGL